MFYFLTRKNQIQFRSELANCPNKRIFQASFLWFDSLAALMMIFLLMTASTLNFHHSFEDTFGILHLLVNQSDLMIIEYKTISFDSDVI